MRQKIKYAREGRTKTRVDPLDLRCQADAQIGRNRSKEAPERIRTSDLRFRTAAAQAHGRAYDSGMEDGLQEALHLLELVAVSLR